MSYPSKKRVNVAAANNNKFNLSHMVYTTHDFGRIKPIVCRYMVPGDSFNYKIQNFTRLLSMPSPTYGTIQMKLRGFFVPCRSVHYTFNELISNNYSYTGPISTVPEVHYTKVRNFVAALWDMSDLVSNPSDVGQWDFKLETDLDSNRVAGYYKFKNTGRIWYDILCSMGLPINFDDASRDVQVNIMPLLSFCKTYFDWIIPSRFIVNSPYKTIQGLINNKFYGGEWDEDQIQLIIRSTMIPFSYYDNDLITSSWKEPFNPEQYANNTLISSPTNYSESVSDNDVDTSHPIGSHIQGSTSANQYINAFTIESLGKLQDYLNRGMLAGSKIQDWLLTEFGIRPSTDALNISTYLGSAYQDFRIGAVVANADTEASGGVALGAYGGVGFTEGVATFDYKAKEHGYFIITTELMPKTNPSDGLAPEFQMLDRLDFFQPEFDNMGVELLSLKDIWFKPRKEYPLATYNPNKAFGYVPRYSKFKYAQNIISGDFANRFGENLKSWYLSRDVATKLLTGTQYINHTWCQVDMDAENWDYIFTDSSSENDHFYEMFIVNCEASRPMLQIEDALNPEHPNGNKSVTLNTNGNLE